MAEQSLCAKLGLRLAIIGSAASLAVAAPIANGDLSTTAHTAANRSGFYFDQTAAAEKIGFIVGGQTGPLLTRSGTDVNVALSGALSVTKQITSTIAIGTAPFVITSTNLVGNLYVARAALADSATTAAAALDGTFAINNTADPTKQFKWSLGGMTAARVLTLASIQSTSQTLTVPNITGSDTIATLGLSNVFTGTANTFNANTDNGVQIGYGNIGFASGGTSTALYIAQTGNYNSTDYALKQLAAGTTTNLNTKTGGTVALSVNNSNIFSTTATAATLVSGATFTASNITDGTSGTAAAINTLGGIGATKAGWFGTNLTWANGVGSGAITDSVTNTTTTVLALAHASSGTVANSFGTQLLFTLADDGGTSRNAGAINVIWTTAASATRTSSIQFQTVNSAASLTTLLTLAPSVITTTTAVTVAIDDVATATLSNLLTINHTSTGTAASGFGSTITINGEDGGGSLRNQALLDAYWTDGAAATRSSAFQMRLVSAAVVRIPFVFSPSVTAGTTPSLSITGISTITGGVTDGYNGSVRLTPTYDAATVQTVTRHNYFDVVNVALTGVGPAALTDAAVFRFNAVPGTHSALAANGAVIVTITGVGPTGAQTTIQGWMKINVNGTLRYVPFW